jgi:hypothetical protein
MGIYGLMRVSVQLSYSLLHETYSEEGIGHETGYQISIEMGDGHTWQRVRASLKKLAEKW